MSQRRVLEQRLASMAEIGDIMRSMKNLAYIETRKLSRLLPNQQALVRQVEAVAEDFLAFYPKALPTAEPSHQVYLLLGSRRGFCGDFNERLDARWHSELAAAKGQSTVTIAVGQKLCVRLRERDADFVGLDGADVAEEIPAVLTGIVRELADQHKQHKLLTLTVLWHRGLSAEPEARQLLPPFEAHRGLAPGHAFAPVLNLAPQEFLLELAEQYLFAALHAILYEALLAENERRLRHLDGAVRHLTDRSDTIQLRVHALRQEEIIEEIEVILLNPVDPG